MSSPNSSVLFEGWLQKRGSDLLGAFGLNWGKRYFKMNSIHLLYYSDFPTSESTLKVFHFSFRLSLFRLFYCF